MRIESWLKHLFRQFRADEKRFRVRRLQQDRVSHVAAMIEALEPRKLLSVAPVGVETRVNTYLPGSDSMPVMAMDAAGDYVVAWNSRNQDGSGYGVFAQRYDAAGTAQAGEFQVNTYTTGGQRGVKVAMDSGGDFVIVWGSAGEDGSGYGIYGQRYNSSGAAQGTEFRVNTYTTGNQGSPEVAMDAAGNFVVTWDSISQDGDGYGVYAQRYNSSGAAQGTEFRVNTYTTGDQLQPDVAMDAAGDFVITWASDGQDGSGYGVYAQRYNALGALQGSEFPVNTFTTSGQAFPSVSMDSSGDFVIVWQGDLEDGDSYGIFGQRYNATGASIAGEFQINTYTTNSQNAPSVAMDSTGDFTVVWQSAGEDGSGYGIYGQRFNVNGTADGGEFLVNTTTSLTQMYPSIATDSTGDFAVAWQSVQNGSPNNIYSQRYKVTTAGPIVTAVLEGSRVVNPNDRLVQHVSTLVVDFSDLMNTTNGSFGVNSVTNPANWRLFRNGVSLHNSIQFITFDLNPTTNRYEATLTFSQPLEDGLYALVAYPTIQNAAGVELDGDVNGVAGGNFQRSFFVAQTIPVGGEIQVNSDGATDVRPSIATDAAGDDVIVWQSQSQDGSGYGVYGQRYNAAGLALGSEFRVNTYTTGNQDLANVAMDSAGDFVVTWQSLGQDGNNWGIYAQRYNSAGVPQGGEFRVNTFAPNAQAHPSIAMDQAGDFVIVWQSNNEDGSAYGVYAQRYNAAGVAQGSEFQVNTYTTGSQREATVAMDVSGDFVITWESFNQDGIGYGVFAQRFSANGMKLGSEFQVNTYTTGDQAIPIVAMDAAGGFVITWQSDGEDGSSFGVFAQRYDDEGIAEGSEFRVNQYTTGGQIVPRVSMDANGDFVIAWSSELQDGSGYGVYSQRFDAAGAPVSDTDHLVNTTTSSDQDNSPIAMDPAGDYVVAWMGDQTGTQQIFSQRYQTDVSPLLYGVELTPLVAPDLLSSPIAPTLLAYDEDNTNWTGATVQFTSNYVNGQDVLGFVNELGITGAWNAATGVMTLSGTSSVSNYRTALQSITYQDTSATPNTTLTRTVTFVVNDGILTSDLVTRAITVSTISVPATLSGVSGTLTYDESDPNLLFAGNLAITDPDAQNLTSATVSFTNWQAEDRLNFNNIFALQHNFTQNLAAHTASLTITGMDTVEHYQTLLRSVEYQDVSQNPVTTPRVSSFTVTDGLSTSNSVSRTINVIAINNPPVLSTIESAPLAYKANDPAFPSLPLSATLLVGDPDSSNCTKATVQITAGYQNNTSGHDVLSFVNQLGITGAFNATTGTLTLSGTSSDSNYRTALRSVKFSTSGTAVSTANRTLSITATDDFSPTPATSAAITRMVTVSTTNIPPALSGIPTTALAYVRGTAAIALAPGMFVLDPDSINMTQAIVQITGNYQNGQDVLAFTAGFGITGSFNTATGTLTLTGMTSLANYQTLLRSVTYKTNSATASTSSRTIGFTINDGLALSDSITRNVNLT